MTKPDSSRSLPVLRSPTLYERATFRLYGRWPDSYVDARMSHHDATMAVLVEMPPDEAARALHDRWIKDLRPFFGLPVESHER